MPTVGDVLEGAACLMNDPSQVTYTDAALLPFCKLAWRRAIGKIYSNDIPVVNEVSSVITYVAGASTISKPADLLFPINVFERDVGSTDDDSWVLMKEEPWSTHGEPVTRLERYVWREGQIVVPIGSVNRDILIEYEKSLETALVSDATTLPVDMSQAWLEHLTAAYAAHFVANNPTRSAALFELANDIMNDFLDTNVKKNQTKTARRRPYRFGR